MYNYEAANGVVCRVYIVCVGNFRLAIFVSFSSSTVELLSFRVHTFLYTHLLP